MLETKEGMPSGASPRLVTWIFLKYYLGVPWASPSLGSCHSLLSSYQYLTQNLETSITQNLTELREIGQYDKDKLFTLVLSKTRFIIVLTQCLLHLIISIIYIEQYKPQKTDHRKHNPTNYALKIESVKNRTIYSNLDFDHISVTPKIPKNQDNVGNLYINHL